MANKGEVLRCTACGGEDLERGQLVERSRLSFYPDGAEALSMTSSVSPVYGYMCMGCGLIQMYGVRKLVAEAVGRFTG